MTVFNLQTFPMIRLDEPWRDYQDRVNKWKEGFEKQLHEDLVFLDATRTWTMNRLKDFYNRLPDISDPALVVTEFQTHVDELITHIQNLEETMNKVLGVDKK